MYTAVQSQKAVYCLLALHGSIHVDGEQLHHERPERAKNVLVYKNIDGKHDQNMRY